MAVFTQVGINEVMGILGEFATCWKTITFVGIAGKNEDVYLPTTVAVSSEDFGVPGDFVTKADQFPDRLLMFKFSVDGTKGIQYIERILTGNTIPVGDKVISFENFNARRAGFLGSNDYEYLHMSELNHNMKEWPRLFVDGEFKNKSWIENFYNAVSQQLEDRRYDFHSLADASSHIVNVRSDLGSNVGLCQFLLRLPITLSATAVGTRLSYSLKLPETLKPKAMDLKITLRTQKGDREEKVELSDPIHEVGGKVFTGYLDMNQHDEPIDVSLGLDGKTITSSRIASQKLAAQNSSENGDKTIEESLAVVLGILAESQDGVTGKELLAKSGLSIRNINDAAELLVGQGLAEWTQTMGNHPFIFRDIEATARGRFEYEKQLKKPPQPHVPTIQQSLSILAVGSPYGFTPQDWETVELKKRDVGRLFVAFGFQFESKHYDAGILKTNLGNMLQDAVDQYNKDGSVVPVELEFMPLAAGYGEHLFNKIARDIISSDIAIFDTSDLNPNVMIEMGVALTWGIRVLPIRKKDCPKPPSDISGQTWAEYEEDGSTYADASHQKKLIEMIRLALRKKSVR